MERESELSELDAALSASGRGAVVVEGPAGIGKSRLLAELRTRGEAGGALVLSSRGSVLEREFSFGVVRQLFEALVVAEPHAARRRRGAGAGAVFDPRAEAAATRPSRRCTVSSG